jgi:hypothetical protein
MVDVNQASMVLLGLSMLMGILVFVGLLVFFGLFVQREYPPTVAEKEAEPAIGPASLARRSAAYRQGFLVLVGLAVLTILEYLVSVYLSSAVMILLMNLAKAGLIVQYYMHVSRLWTEEAH